MNISLSALNVCEHINRCPSAGLKGNYGEDAHRQSVNGVWVGEEDDILGASNREITVSEVWMKIDREFDGSYGVASIEYDNPYLLVFDDYDLDYQPGDGLGLVEESTSVGWGPRTFFVANSGLMPTQFNVVWDAAQAGLSLAASLILLISLQFQ